MIKYYGAFLKYLLFVLIAILTFGELWSFCRTFICDTSTVFSDDDTKKFIRKAIGSKAILPLPEIAEVQTREKLSITSAPGEKAAAVSMNFVKSPDFETPHPRYPNKPACWETLTELKPPFADLTAEYLWEGNIAPSGHRALTIKQKTSDKEAAWIQIITGLEPGKWYRATAWLKVVDDMEYDFKNIDRGASLKADFFIPGISEPVCYTSGYVTKEQDWQKQELTFVVPDNYSHMALRLNNAHAKGSISWADVAIVPLEHRNRSEWNIARLSKIKKTELDQFGGWKKIKGNKTGYFHTEKIGNRWWLITPEGHGFIVAGVIYEHFSSDSVYMTNAKRLYLDEDQRISTITSRLANWGFNTVFSFPPLKKFAYEVVLSPRTQARIAIDPSIRVNFVHNLDNPYAKISYFPDVFDPKFRYLLDREARKMASSLKKDPWLLGYSLGLELPWDYFLLEMFLALPETRPGKRAAVAFLQKHYKNQVKPFNAVWGTQLNDFKELMKISKLSRSGDRRRMATDQAAFLSLVADLYFRAGHEAVKKYDPNHMILGARFGGREVPLEVLKISGKYLDVASFQPYDPIAPLETLEKSFQHHQKPVLITEFSFHATDSGLPNALGAGITLPSQKDRGLFFQRYVSHLLTSPFAVGYVWYRYVDDLPDHNQVFHRESCNYGLVDKNDKPYTELVEKIKILNQRLYYLATSNHSE